MEAVSQILGGLRAMMTTIVPGALLLFVLMCPWIANQTDLLRAIWNDHVALALCVIPSFVAGTAMGVFKQEWLAGPRWILSSLDRLACKVFRIDPERKAQVQASALGPIVRERVAECAQVRVADLHNGDVEYLMGARLAKTQSFEQVRRLSANADILASFASVFAFTAYSAAAKLVVIHTAFQLTAVSILVGLALVLTIASDRWFEIARRKALAAIVIEEPRSEVERELKQLRATQGKPAPAAVNASIPASL